MRADLHATEGGHFVAPWEAEFAVDFINDEHFHVTEPGPLLGPVLNFSLRRDEDLSLVLETRALTDPLHRHREQPSGVFRADNAQVQLEGIGGIKVTLIGVVVRERRTSFNHEAGKDEHHEVSTVHALEAVIASDEPNCTIDWLANLPADSFHWPQLVKKDTETTKTCTIGLGDDEIRLFARDAGHSFSAGAVKFTISDVTAYLCALDRENVPQSIKPGCIIYVGHPDEEFRKRVRGAISFTLGAYLVELGSAVFDKKWSVLAFKSRSAYSIDRKVFRRYAQPPAPLGQRWQGEITQQTFIRMVNGIFSKYEELNFGDLGWAYWHALCATPHIAPVHFGAALEMLFRRYIESKPGRYASKIIPDKSVWKALCSQIMDPISALEISEASKAALRKNISGLNRVNQRDLMASVLDDLNIGLGKDEAKAWNRRNDAAHGMEMELGEELAVIRDIKLLHVFLNRVLLRMTGGSDLYIDYTVPTMQIRNLGDPVPDVEIPAAGYSATK